MAGYHDYYECRRDLVEEIIADLRGPTAADEVISDDPLTRYIVGVLYPQRSGTVDAAFDTGVDDEDDEQPADPPVAMANVKYPSSMGMTFAVDTVAAATIRVEVRAARYVRIEGAGAQSQSIGAGADGEPLRRASKGDQWRREALSPPPIRLEVRTPVTEYRSLGVHEMQLFCRVRQADDTGIAAVTLVLLNGNVAATNEGRSDDKALLQAEIAVTSPDASADPFVERPVMGAAGDDADLRSYRLLYRNAREFAVGHGCSVEWEPKAAARAREIRTTFTPEYELLLADSNPDIPNAAMGMQYLSTGNRADVVARLAEFRDGYEEWVAAKEQELRDARDLDADQLGAGRDHMRACRTALGRIRAGIGVLTSDDLAWQAFGLMNAAMAQQRARSVWLRDGKPAPAPVVGPEHGWRPFQLAFILMCLPGIVDPSHEDRGVADLLWFPTGGGKTEAYLGLIAFTLFLRRLRKPSAGGVTAIMRYTLRLLTIQQFERAALLMCCCEAIRRDGRDGLLGTTPFSVGLWLGRGATPNTLDEARTALNKLKTTDTLETENPVQLHACPWCGHPLGSRNYWIADSPPRMVVSCRQDGCLFGKALPVHLIDDDVYRYMPSLVIATVDKFAALPWSDKTAALFNLLQIGQGGDPVPPPELIVQDELHLISGPLGTLVGLYETAVDAVCSQSGAPPKVIASTATIRRAEQQGLALFNRVVRQFPPPGLSAGDSYFAVEAGREDKGTRLYLGLTAPGTSHTTLMVRVYAALLQRIGISPFDDGVKDPYWTLVGYFNSLRVLGAARMQVQDDVGDRMTYLATASGQEVRPIDERIELTSREPSSSIPAHLKAMAVSHPDPRSLAVILATNMISVGVDIDRLGLMVVMGQPQSTSEYIQSTSRVGRKYPGLVVALLNSAKSRDRSHYERFVAYHSALYREVESTSVTPFSARSRDRGLHAVLVALLRLLVPSLRANSSAKALAQAHPKLAEIREIILQRVRAVSSADEAAAAAAQLDEIVQLWLKRAAEGDLVYRDMRHPSKALLRDASERGPDREDGLPTMWSLRDVDTESGLYLIG